MDHTRALNLTVLLSSILFTACGGGSNNSSNNRSTVPTTMVAPQTTELNALLERRVYSAESVSASKQLSVNIDADAVSILVNLQNEEIDAGMAVVEITDPDGDVLYSAEIGDEGPERLDSDYFGVLAGEGELSLLLPPSPELSLQPGDYTIRFITEDDTEISGAKAYVKSQPADTTLDRTDLYFDLNVWVAHPEDRFNGESFRETVNTAYLTNINSILDKHGMAIKNINFFYASDDAVVQFADVDIDSEFRATCRSMLAQTGTGLALNLAFVRSLSSSEDNGIAGVSGQPGTLESSEAEETCFMVSQSAYEADPANGFPQSLADQMQAGNILHEASHFMSLSHPSEGNGEEFDKITDTPECDITTFDGRDNAIFDVPGERDGEVSDHECSYEGGADNVIFYAGHPDFLPFHLTDDQAWVLRRHPLALPETVD